MHLVFENIIKTLVMWWTGTFKDLDCGTGLFKLDDKVWEAVGRNTASAGSMIPSAFGARPPNVAEDKQATTADTWSFWLLYIAPVLLDGKLPPPYHHHLCDLSSIVNQCLQFEISQDSLQLLRKACEKWVVDYEKLYYQGDPNHSSACPLTIHGLLHVVDGIEEIGPVWTNWAFPTERFCGRLQPAIKSRRHPFAAIDNYIIHQAHLSQIKLLYGVEAELSLKEPSLPIPTGSFGLDDYPSCIFLPPHRPSSSVPKPLIDKIIILFATRFNSTKTIVHRYIKQDSIVQWAKVRRLQGGDDMLASSLTPFSEDRRDATFVRYDMLVDKNARRRNAEPLYERQSFYGQLQNLFVVTVSAADELQLDTEKIFMLAAIQRCKMQGTTFIGAAHYEQIGAVEVVDIGVIQCLIGRICALDDRRTFIIDRSDSLQASYYIAGE
ncbi:hypothetical protein C8R42DRAFT_698103 [Lentinula raphanica]|nr:hypothetical protein C8R42DRAFT_698103 [Lentinula raphanica]